MLEESLVLIQDHSQGSSAISLLSDLLKLDWRKRINAIDALQHPYFQSPPLPAKPGDLPQFEDSHELDRRKFRGQKAALPPAPAGGTVGMGSKGDWANSAGLSSKGSYANGHGSRNSSGGAGYGGGGEGFQGPAGIVDHRPPRNGYDHWVSNPHQHSRMMQQPPGTSGHRATWDRNGLPPKPPPTHQPWGNQGWASESQPDGREHRPPPARAGLVGGAGGLGDTYIPSYAAGGDSLRARDDRGRREDRADRGQSVDRRYYDHHLDYGSRRSRSPHRSRDRDRTRERDRDLYRR